MKKTDTLKITIPGKAFIAGEYLALSGEPALVAAIEPRFSLSVHFSDEKNNCPFHRESPAGILWGMYVNFLENYELKYQDPHYGQGGWGSSTAEFALLHSFIQQRESLWSNAQPLVDTHLMLREYREIAGKNGATPSGADLVGQVKGGLTLFDRNHGRILNFAWLFSDLGFYLAKTKNKIATHEHLKNLSEFNSKGLLDAMMKIQNGLLTSSSNLFAESLREYALILEQLGFLHTDTKNILAEIKNPAVVAKKGCGALGADVVLVVYQKQNAENIKLIEEIENLGLRIIASESDLSQGIQHQIIPELKFSEVSP